MSLHWGEQRCLVPDLQLQVVGRVPYQLLEGDSSGTRCRSVGEPHSYYFRMFLYLSNDAKK